LSGILTVVTFGRHLQFYPKPGNYQIQSHGDTKQRNLLEK